MSELFSIGVAFVAYGATVVSGAIFIAAAVVNVVHPLAGSAVRRTQGVGAVAAFGALVVSVGAAGLWDLFLR